MDETGGPQRRRGAFGALLEWARRATQRIVALRWARVSAFVAVALAAIVALGHGLGGIVGIWEFYRLVTGTPDSREHEASKRQASAVRPFRSLAVVPFAAPSGDEARLAEALTEDLTVAIARSMRGAYVASLGVARRYNAAPYDPRRVGDDLNVRYVVEGTLRTRDGKHDLVVDLVDTSSGAQAWQDRRVIATDSAEAAGRLANDVRRAIEGLTTKEIDSLPARDRKVWKLIVEADALPLGLAEQERAKRLYAEALKLDGASVPAMLGIAETLRFELLSDPLHEHEQRVRQLDEITARATSAAGADPRAWLMRSVALQYQGNWPGAFAASDRAMQIDPYYGSAFVARALLMLYAGRATEALPLASRALEVDKGSATGAWFVQCYALMLLARDAEAIAPCETLAGATDAWPAHAFLMAAYANLGNAAKSDHWKARLLAERPRFSLAEDEALALSDNATYIDQRKHLQNGYRRAGIPER